MATAPLLSVRRLRVQYPKRSLLPWARAAAVKAIDDLHFDLRAGETLGIVGESGCGKSTLARTLVGLQAADGGSIRFDGRELVGLSRRDWKPLRRDVQLVFQDPLGSLSPKQKVVDLIAEPLKALQPALDANARRDRALALMARVGLGPELAERRAKELSGGQGQRVGIARALIVEPKLLICDEPVSALDVSIQAQIINLLADLAAERGLAMVFISHDLAVVRQLADRIMVLYLGKVMEQGSADDVCLRARHPYTRALLAAVPAFPVEPDADAAPAPVATRPPAREELAPMGCVFHPRCPLADNFCVQSVPGLRKIEAQQYVACHFIAGVPDIPVPTPLSAR